MSARKTKRKTKQQEEWRPLAVVTREGKTTIRRLEGRRFVRFGEVRGKRVAWVEFFSAEPNFHTISVRFQDRTVFCLHVTPLFTLKADYYSLKTSDVEMIKQWPEMKCER